MVSFGLCPCLSEFLLQLHTTDTGKGISVSPGAASDGEAGKGAAANGNSQRKHWGSCLPRPAGVADLQQQLTASFSELL